MMENLYFIYFSLCREFSDEIQNSYFVAETARLVFDDANSRNYALQRLSECIGNRQGRRQKMYDAAKLSKKCLSVSGLTY